MEKVMKAKPTKMIGWATGVCFKCLGNGIYGDSGDDCYPCGGTGWIAHQMPNPWSRRDIDGQVYFTSTAKLLCESNYYFEDNSSGQIVGPTKKVRQIREFSTLFEDHRITEWSLTIGKYHYTIENDND